MDSFYIKVDLLTLLLKKQSIAYMQRLEKKILPIGTQRYAVNIHYEPRYGSRVSITNRGINIRISDRLSESEQLKQIDEHLKWAQEKIAHRLKQAPPLPPYTDGSVVTFMEQSFTLHIQGDGAGENVHSRMDLVNKKILFRFPPQATERAIQKNVGILLQDYMSQYFLPIIRERLHYYNQLHLQKKIAKVSLRNTSTRWGSCTYDGKISISTRLLFAPIWVVDYVLIHELCHLVHHDHSAAFWNLVGKIYPNYKAAEKYLAEHGGRYNY